MFPVVATCLLLLTGALWPAMAQQFEYRVLATNRTSTMEKELNEAAGQGFEYRAVMGGESAFGGKEVVVIMGRGQASGVPGPKRYKLLATRKTSTMEKELNAAAREGFAYKGQTVFESTFGGREVALILEQDSSDKIRHEYKLLAASRTSTMEKELKQAGAEGFDLVGMTIGSTSFGGNEVVSILRKQVE